VILLSVLSWTPIWLDEVQQLRGTRDKTVRELLDWVFVNPGGVPLAYLTQKVFLDVFGYSTFVARLPAALFSILGGFAFGILCRQVDWPAPRAALLLFLFVPLEFRYGLEARGYSQGLFFCVLSFCLLMRLRSRVGARDLVLYWLSLVLGLYSQPLSFLIAGGQGLWALFSQAGARFKVTILSAIGAAGLSFVPWVILEREIQRRAGTMDAFWFSSEQISGFVLLRELAGDGYLCSIPLLVLAVVAIRSAYLRPDMKGLFLTAAIAGFAGPIVADASFHYFFAARQFLFGIPALVLLASAGAYDLWRKGQRIITVVLVAALSAGAVAKDYKQATKPTEDWEAAAATVADKLQQGGCFLAAPPDQLVYYAFFRPALRARVCAPGRSAEPIVTAMSPYTSQVDEKHLLESLPVGFVRSDATLVGRIRIAVYRRR
jgi:uncharacterized membrane protein